jgi:catechol 2,3-dioxygenase-like lactoylglutathione lyase family enzyme
MDAKLHVVSLWAEDLHPTAHFYRDVIGLRLMPHHGDRPHFDLGGVYMVLVEGKPAVREEGSSDRFPVLTFAVKDLEEAINHLRAHEVDLPWEIEVGHGMRWIMFHDPAGNLIEFVEFLF